MTARNVDGSNTVGENPVTSRERLAVLEKFAAGLAHEINNPLTVILGFCEILMERTAPETPEFSDLSMIWKNGLRCKKIIQELLCFAQEYAETGIGCDVNALAAEALASMQPSFDMKGIRTTRSLTGRLPVVRGESAALRRSLVHLMENALKIMSEGGSLTISTRLVPEGDRVELVIADDGPGIPKDARERVFDPFFTAWEDGTGSGLGLSICYGVIARLGGTIECESATEEERPGQSGTAFTLLLPVKG